MALASEKVGGRTDPHVIQLTGEMTTAHLAGSDLVAAMLESSNDLRFDNVDEHLSRTLARKTVAAEAPAFSPLAEAA